MSFELATALNPAKKSVAKFRCRLSFELTAASNPAKKSAAKFRWRLNFEPTAASNLAKKSAAKFRWRLNFELTAASNLAEKLAVAFFELMTNHLLNEFDSAAPESGLARNFLNRHTGKEHIANRARIRRSFGLAGRIGRNFLRGRLN